jgi:hypothetical protein
MKKLKISKDVITVIAKTIIVVVAEMSTMAVVSNIVNETMPEDASESYKKWSRIGGLFIGGIAGAVSAKYALEVIDPGENTLDMEILKGVLKGTSFNEKELE